MNCDDVLPIYVGDDRTDEDAFKVSREGNRGDGIIVSSLPKESNAFYSVRDTSEGLGNWQQKSSHGWWFVVRSFFTIDPLLREGEKEADEMGRKINYLIEEVSREGNRGDGIIVSSLPKESNAFYSVRDTSEVWAIGSNNHLMVGGLLLEVSSHRSIVKRRGEGS
ncbi:hypothetical protein CASFOL_005968 [Castilleja foliolosa]|uniref:Trehalose-phosphatase n=1 Tax=Castilleja foliolosa TaxID=1961234 RepID=A0ABD3E4Z1_9LAMI